MKCRVALGVLALAAATQLPLGCSLPVSNKCNTTADCFSGQCVAGVCQVIRQGDANASAPDVPPDASEVGAVDQKMDSQSDGSMDGPPDSSVDARVDSSVDAAVDAAPDASDRDLPSNAPDAKPDAAPDETSGASNDARSDVPSDVPPDAPADASSASQASSDAGSSGTLSTCPAWADWPMPTPPSLTGVPSDPQRNLPNPQSYDTSAPDVVTDNVTQLLWQKELSPSFLSWSQATSYCAGLDLAGRTDWRLPSRIELVSLVDFTEPLLNINPAFPDSTRDKVWTCSAGPGNPLVAWIVDFAVAGSALDDKTTHMYRARCVSGARPTTPPPTRYDTTTLGEVRDLKTLLTWRAALAPGEMPWGQAYSYCQALGSTWRLPSMMEIQTLVDENQATSAVNPTAFPDRPDDFYWTSSFFNVTLNTAWFASIGSGNTYWLATTDLALVRCVR